MIYKLALHSPVALLFHLIYIWLSYLKELLFLLSTEIHCFNWKMMSLAATTPWKFSSICLYADHGAWLCSYLFIFCSQSVLLLDLPTTSAASSKWCLTLDLWTSVQFLCVVWATCRTATDLLWLGHTTTGPSTTVAGSHPSWALMVVLCVRQRHSHKKLNHIQGWKRREAQEEVAASSSFKLKFSFR